MTSLPLRASLAAIRLYQRTISPDHGFLRYFTTGPTCRFTPTCSTYAHDVIQHHGWPGVHLAVRRIARCHPYHPGGSDPVPKTLVTKN